MKRLRFILVEDDEDCVAMVRAGLAAAGHHMVHAASCAEVTDILRERRFDAMILDRLLPCCDGEQMLREWREAGFDLPVLILTALSGLHDRVRGLDAGADDYLAKPFEPIELEARLRALVRRHRGGAESHNLSCGSIEIDRLRREVRRGGQRIHLQPREHKLLEELALQPGYVVPRAMLLQSVWNLQFDPRTKLIESHVSRLREKLNAGFAVDAIETVRGIGYRLRTDA